MISARFMASFMRLYLTYLRSRLDIGPIEWLLLLLLLD